MMFEVGAWNKKTEKRRKRGRLYMWLYVRRLRVVTRFVSLVFFITLFFTLLFSLVPPAQPGTHEHLLRLRWPLDRHHFTTFLVTIELTTFSTTLLAFDLWRNYYIKHVVLFEENSIESGPEKETSVRPEKETRDRIRALFSMAQVGSNHSHCSTASPS